jgi:uncharacterized protein YkwD
VQNDALVLDHSADSSVAHDDSMQPSLAVAGFEAPGPSEGPDDGQDAPSAVSEGQPGSHRAPPTDNVTLAVGLAVATPASPAQVEAPSPNETPRPALTPPTATPTTRPPPIPTATPAPRLPSPALTPPEQEMLAAHNRERAAAGLSTLSLDAILVRVARERAQDMATQNYFAHTSPSGQTAFDLMAAQGFVAYASGENLARNNYPSGQSVATAMSAFMASDGHRENLLNPRYTRAGIGHAITVDGMNYYAVLFASP